MKRITIALVLLIGNLNQLVAQEERIWPDVRLSCRGSSSASNPGSEKKEHIVYIRPRLNELTVFDGGLRRLQTTELVTYPNTYSYSENGQGGLQTNRFEIDRTSLQFSIGYQYGASSYFSASGSCVVVEPRI